MQKDLQIKTAQLKDLPDLARLFNNYRVFYKQAEDLKSCETFIKERLEAHESTVFLALLDSKAVGFTQLFPSFTSVGMSRLWILNDLYVDQEVRGQGVGRGLLEHAAAWAKGQGAARLILETHHTNHAAQKLYESLNWVKDVEAFHYALSLD